MRLKNDTIKRLHKCTFMQFLVNWDGKQEESDLSLIELSFERMNNLSFVFQLIPTEGQFHQPIGAKQRVCRNQFHNKT